MDIKKITHDLNQYRAQIIEILSAEGWSHFRWYFFIKEQFTKKEFGDTFKRRFCWFYVMNGVGGLTKAQKDKFFELLSSAETDLRKILRELYEIHGYQNVQRLFLSFGTKLLHTLDEKLPIYDGNIASVFDLPFQTQTGFLEEKITDRITIYKILQENSRKLLKDTKVRESLKDIRKQLRDRAGYDNFPWQDGLVPEEKLLDSVLWALHTAKNSGKKS